MRTLLHLPVPAMPALLRWRALVPAVIFGCGVLASVGLWQAQQQQQAAQRQAAFDFLLSKFVRQLDAHFAASTQVLRGVAGYFAASREVDRTGFRHYVAVLRLGDRYPGIQGVGFAQLLAPEQLARHEARVRAEGFPNYGVRPAAARSFYTSILFLEPFDWRNQRAFGFDMFTNPVRREAMARARDSGQVALSGRVHLEQETDEDVQAGVLLYVPVYREGEGGLDVAQRRESLQGWAFAPLRMKDLVGRLLARELPELQTQLALELYDSATADPEQLLYRSERWAGASSEHYVSTLTLQVAGRSWSLRAHSLPGFEEGGKGLHGRGMLLLGTLASALLASLVGLILTSHVRTVEALQESAEVQQQLSQSQAELQSVFDTSGVGMLQVDTFGVVRRVNQRMAEMFGRVREGMPGMPYENLVPPEDRERVRQRIAELVSSEMRELNIERRYCRADGTSFWGMLSARRLLDRQGGTIGLVGVIVDITARRNAELRLTQSEQRYRTLTESMQDVVWCVDPVDMRITYCSPSLRALCGFSAEDALFGGLAMLFGARRAEWLQARWRERVECYRRGEVEAGHAWLDELEHLCALGEAVPVELSSCCMVDPEGGALLLRCVTRNISERKRHEQAQRVAAVAFESHESMLVTNAAGVIIKVNQAFCDLTGFSSEEVLGKTPRLLHSGRHDAEFYAEMWRCINNSGFWQGEIWNRHKDGRVYPVWLTITAVRDEEGRTTHYVGSSFDITRQVQHQSEIRNLAFYDPLTGLANRRLFTDRLGHAFAKSGRSKLFGAVLYIDLDRFKEVNDSLGHAEGDRLLELVADRISTNVREGDTVARFGGDEFVVLLEDVGETREEALSVVIAVAEKLRQALATPYHLHGAQPGEHVCSSSIGVAVFRGSQEEMESVLLRADRALYAAKDGGRNAVCVGEGCEEEEGTRHQD
ncbi:sensor domain-containing diguanylate cyclase [Uliginosibacterium aquaticum]|uniref:CHASE domain-containing protein n=1 Tax=Uliginosibacterium aquaticum TaxID=2731212 RepID=A0ABX2IIP7_9RHOO|nr:CHASE domain-containing protein [Uliginosibacterium aquaticum]NSL54489.1 CHASE domain-containing protein [Uliginosibacterium aquaticum]